MKKNPLPQNKDSATCLMRTKFSDLCEIKGEVIAKEMLIATIDGLDSNVCSACSNMG